MGRFLLGGRPWRLRERQLANRSGVPARGPGDARRPSVAGVVLTGLINGRAGLREVV